MTKYQPLPDLPDGIYFELPEDVYHALPRLSASAFKNMNVSAAYFWAQSWLNPARTEELAVNAFYALQKADALTPLHPVIAKDYGNQLCARWPDLEPPVESLKEAEKRAGHFALGNAYHAARLEPDRLETDFARQPSKADYAAEAAEKGAAWNSTEIGNELAKLKMTKKQAGEAVYAQALRLKAAGYEGVIWPLIEGEFQEGLGDRQAIPGEEWDAMIEDMNRLRASKEVAALLSGGFAEVTVLYTGDGGIKRKVRFDYLTPDHWADLKTFTNTNRKPVQKAILDAFLYNGYYLQAAAYLEAAELLRANVLEIIGDFENGAGDLIAKLEIAPERLRCFYVFLEKGGIPNIIAKEIGFQGLSKAREAQAIMAEAAGLGSKEQQAAARKAQETDQLWLFRAQEEMRIALKRFDQMRQIFPDGDPWLPIEPIGLIDDMSFPAYWLDERI